MRTIIGELGRSSAGDLSAQEAANLWSSAKARLGAAVEEQVAFDAGYNLARNRATPAEVLHDMVVTRNEKGNQILRRDFMDRVPFNESLQAIVGHPNTSAETLYVIANNSRYPKEGVAARQMLKKRLMGASLRQRLEMFSAKRRASGSS